MKNVRQMVEDYQKEARTDLLPMRASQILVELSSLLGNITNEISEAQIDFNQVLLSELDKDQTASKARIRAEVTEEYKRLITAKNTLLVAKEMIGGIKYYLRAAQEDMRYSGGQV